MSKIGAVGHGVGSLLSFLIRIVVNVLQYTALTVSLGVTVYAVGDYTRQAIHDKKTILDIVYWRDPKRSGITLAIILFTLYLFSRCTIVSLLAYGALAVLGAALGFRAYKFFEAQLKKTDGSNPFKPYLEQEVIIPQEKFHAQMDVLIEHGQCVFKQLRHLFLVESLVDSVKFGLMLYTLTYIGSWFSGVTLVLIFIVALFSLPKVYELYKDPIDGNLSIAQDAINSARQTITGKFPFLKKVIEAEKKEQ